jgi:thymidylate synthase (FAD)
MIVTHNGINYTRPKVFLLQHSGLGVAEFAGRTAYDSFNNSENEIIREANNAYSSNEIYNWSELNNIRNSLNNIESSELLDSLSWVHHHHSVIELANISYLVKGTSRGVLQEHARHRIQSLTVRSTRYTMSSIINAFLASLRCENSLESKLWFRYIINTFDMFVTSDTLYNVIEIDAMWEKLNYQVAILGDKFYEISVAKSSLEFLKLDNPDEIFEALQNGKKKRNVGDSFKHIITDNFKCDLVFNMNLRSLKNYLTLRNSGAAYFQINWLAEEIIKVTPQKYLDLIIKKK